jgi:hypothetical protein
VAGEAEDELTRMRAFASSDPPEANCMSAISEESGAGY